MGRTIGFILRRRGGKFWHWTDIVTWVWLIGGLPRKSNTACGLPTWLMPNIQTSPKTFWPSPPRKLPRNGKGVATSGKFAKR